MNTCEISDADRVEEFRQELKSSNPELYKVYEEAILGRNPGALREKTQKQFEDLKRKFGSKKYKEFLKFVDNLIIVRSDNFQGDTFEAPIHTGNQTHGGYFGDQLVKAENYVYASFDKIRHSMTYLNPDENTEKQIQENKGLHCLNDKDCEGKAELVFCDIANIGQARNFGDNNMGCLEAYMTNCFEFSEGKKLLALYLSIIFESPEDIVGIFRYNNIQSAQHWHGNSFWDEYKRQEYQELAEKNKDKPEDVAICNKIILEFTRKIDIIERMKKVFLETGIIPPYSLEIRIPDRVNKADIQDLMKDKQRTFAGKIHGILDNIFRI